MTWDDIENEVTIMEICWMCLENINIYFYENKNIHLLGMFCIVVVVVDSLELFCKFILLKTIYVYMVYLFIFQLGKFYFY